jgi:hypothetical protein
VAFFWKLTRSHLSHEILIVESPLRPEPPRPILDPADANQECASVTTAFPVAGTYKWGPEPSQRRVVVLLAALLKVDCLVEWDDARLHKWGSGKKMHWKIITHYRAEDSIGGYLFIFEGHLVMRGFHHYNNWSAKTEKESEQKFKEGCAKTQ